MMREFKYRPEKFDHFQLVYHFTVPLKNYKKTFRLKSLNTCFFFKEKSHKNTRARFPHRLFIIVFTRSISYLELTQ